MSRLIDAPTLISPRNPGKGLSECFQEHRQAIKAARQGSEVRAVREAGALVVGYAPARG